MEDKQPLNTLASEIHAIARWKGFWEDVSPESLPYKCMLIVTEISEAVEADRDGETFARTHPEMTIAELEKKLAKLSPEQYAEQFKELVKDKLEDEMADALIRIFDLCAFLGIDIDTHVRMKMRYNDGREYKHGKRY